MARPARAPSGASLQEILDLHSEPYVPGRCRLWLGAADRHGYGHLAWQGRSIKAHRAAWIVTHGPISNGLWVLHHCDTPACINAYDCLFLGTHAENMADMVAKKRQGRGDVRFPGETHWHARLTEADVLDIRAMPSDVPQWVVAAMYGIDPSAISHIRSRRNWAHL